jgi:hypothetical protein
MHIVSDIFKILWSMHPHRFWAIWTTTLGAAVIYITSVFWQTTTARCVAAQQVYPTIFSSNLKTRRVGLPLILLTLFLALYVGMILVGEDFADHDDSMFILTTLRGHDFGVTIWPINGRFFPFALMEFNLVRHFTRTDVGYHVLPILQVLIFSGILILISDLNVAARAFLTVLILVTPSILFSFSTLGFEERNVLFFLLVLVLSVVRFEQTQSVGWAVLAVVSAQIMLYYKETSFLLVLGFVGGRLILRCIQGEDAGWNRNRLWDREARLEWCLASLAGLFLFCYFAVMGFHANLNYVYEHREPMKEIVSRYFRLDLLAWVLAGVTLWRVYLILRRRAEASVLWDGLALGGVCFFLGYLYLRLFSAYYLAPTDLIAVLYLGRLVVLSWKGMQLWTRAATTMVILVILFQTSLLSTLVVFERKNAVRAKVEMASAIEGQYRRLPALPIRLFFPFGQPYSIMEFAYYLNYRNIPLGDIFLTARSVAKDSLCVSYRRLVCHAATRPSPGDLVIVFPDDETSSAEASMYREGGALLFSYEPRPSLPQWLYSVVGSLPLAGAKYTHSTRPDRWMSASMTAWKEETTPHLAGEVPPGTSESPVPAGRKLSRAVDASW